MLLLIINLSACVQKREVEKTSLSTEEDKLKLIFSDDFENDTKQWITEFENPNSSNLKVINGKLDLSSTAGATVWFKNKLKGNLIITYNVTIVDKGGLTDRVSDMNTFWMATNPKDENLFKQDGKFSSYDHLNLYYAGIGGHNNTKTRFRKYEGSGSKDILKEYTDEAHLLVGNKEYRIKIIINNNLIQYYLDDNLYWEFNDLSNYKEGYFGFRTTNSHQLYENFRVFKF